MPLIIITGLPCSGKTTIAHKLKTFFETKKKIKTKIACEENFYTSEENRNTIYSGWSYRLVSFLNLLSYY